MIESVFENAIEFVTECARKCVFVCLCVCVCVCMSVKEKNKCSRIGPSLKEMSQIEVSNLFLYLRQ